MSGFPHEHGAFAGRLAGSTNLEHYRFVEAKQAPNPLQLG